MIEILGMTGCNPCKSAKEMLSGTDLDWAYYNVKNRGNTRTVELKRVLFKEGVTTMPAILRDGAYVGTGLQTLETLLKEIHDSI